MDQDILSDLTREQRRHLEDVRELWDVWSKLARKRDVLAGAMAWKPVKGRDYLVRYWNDEDIGDKRMTSLGPRSPESEAAKAEFERNRAAVDGALAQLKGRLDALARVGKALRVGRLETPASDVLRQFWRADMLGADLMVAGSAAIHLYEASAGVRVPQAIVPEGDLDLLMVVGGRLDFDDIERVARRADKTFRWQRDRKSLNNNDGFRIDIIDRVELHWRERFEPEWLEPFPELARSLGHEDPDGGGPAFFRGPRI